MPLYFRARRPLSPRAQYLIAFAVLALVLVALASWLAVRYHRSRPAEEPETDSSATSTVTYTDEDDGTLLLIFTDTDAERFLLVHTAPSDNAVYVVPLPADTLTEQEQTLRQLLRKSGAAKVTEAVAAVTALPIRRYMALGTEEAESFLADLGDGVTYAVPEEVRFTDTDGSTVQLSAGEQPLSAGQIAALLRYDGWQSTTFLQAGGDILVTVLNRFLLPQRSLRGDFAALSNLADTNLRIDDYNAYREPLLHLATANAQAPICRRLDVAGHTDEQGRFILDATALGQSPLGR